MLCFGLQIIAVILAVFLHHGNGRAITSTINDNIERILDLDEEELNMIFNEPNERTTEGEENPADFLRLSGKDSSSHEEVQSHHSSDNMIQPKEAGPVLRQKRSHTGPCYTGLHQTVTRTSGGIATFPICKNVTLTGCESSITKYSMRKCEGSNFVTVNVRLTKGVTETRVFPTKCSCAV